MRRKEIERRKLGVRGCSLVSVQGPDFQNFLRKSQEKVTILRKTYDELTKNHFEKLTNIEF